MQSTVDPYASDSESLATSAQGEIQRLRYILENVFGWANWYRRDTSIDFAQGTGIDGVGQGRHVTAVGYHSWSGSLRWPAITSVAAHTSGIFWPAAHHLTIGFDATSDSGRFGSGQTNARSWYTFHADALTLHHTAALRFASSEGPMQNGQRGHVTALRLRGGGSAADDGVVVGHAGSRLYIESAHITGGSSQVLAVSATGLLSTTTSSTAGMWSSRGQFSGVGRSTNAGHFFTLAAHFIAFMNASSHVLTTVSAPAAVTVDFTVTGPVINGRDRAAAVFPSGNQWVHYYWIYDGTTVAGIASPNAPSAGGPNLPHTYTSWSYAGPVYLDGTSQLVPVHILGSMAYYHQGIRMLSSGTSTTEATVDLATVVPPNATDALLNVQARLAANGGEATIRYANPTTGASRDFLTMRSGAAAVDYRNSTQAIVPNVSQRIFYLTIQAGGTVQLDIDALGYRIPSGG